MTQTTSRAEIHLIFLEHVFTLLSFVSQGLILNTSDRDKLKKELSTACMRKNDEVLLYKSLFFSAFDKTKKCIYIFPNGQRSVTGCAKQSDLILYCTIIYILNECLRVWSIINTAGASFFLFFL